MYADKSYVGIVFCDISTGQLFVSRFKSDHSFSQLKDQITAYSPKELLICGKLAQNKVLHLFLKEKLGSASVSHPDESLCGLLECTSLLERHFNKENMDKIADSNELIIALGIPNKQFIKLLNVPVVKVGTNGDVHPMGSGPYMYNEEGTQLLAFNGYNGYENLPVDVIYLKEYSTAEDIIAAFEDSYVDVIINDPSSYTNLGYASSNEIRAFPTTNMHYIAFNETSDSCRYNNVRAALQYAFDREYLANEMLHGNGVASAVPMYPTCTAYPTALADSLAFDLEKCRMILQNFGLKDADDNGMFDSMSGVGDLTFTMILCSDSSAKAGMAQKFAQDMRTIGITVKIYELSWEDYLKALEDGELEISENRTVDYDMYYAEVKLRNDFDMTELLQVRDEDNEKTNINFTNSHDSSYETYINNYLAATDAARATAYYAFCYYLSQNATIIPLGFEKQQIITHRGVIKGVDANAGNPLYGFPNWEIDLS